MNSELISIWHNLNKEEKNEIFSETAVRWNLPAAAIEKDWWVVQTLQLIFETEIAPHTVFKGGTSLSKAWNLISRFSEDIDLALDRKFLGFDREDVAMSGSQVSKLRKYSFKYIAENYLHQLKNAFHDSGFAEMKLELTDVRATDDDPVKIAVLYPSITGKVEYLKPQVLIEIGSRSLMEPFTQKQFCSLVGEYFKGRSFADSPITIPVVNPERTFLEKIFLLHEEFQKPGGKIERKSRHLYDLEKLMDTQFGKKALADKNLYQHIVAHSRTITPVRGIEYDNHSPEKINIIPPERLMDAWARDYKLMQESMIYTHSVSFDKLMERMEELKSRINKIN